MKEQKQKNFSLLPYLFRYGLHYLIGIIILWQVDQASLYIPQYTGEIIDGLSRSGFGFEQVKPILLNILIAGLVMMFGRFGWRYCIIGASRGIEYRMRNDLFAHLETLSARFFNSHKTGDLMAHFTNDLQAIRMAVGMAVITTFDAVVMTVMVLVKMIRDIDFRLTILAFVPLILVAFGCYFYGIEAKKRQTKRQEAFSHLSDKVQESLAGIRVLKAFVQEEKDFASFEEASVNSMEKNLSVVKLRAIFGPALDAVTGFSLLLTLILGGRMVLNGQISIGQFVAFNSYIGMLVWPMIACGDCINSFSQAAAAYHRIAAIFRVEPDIVDPCPEAEHTASPPDALHLTGDIRLEHLTFTYPDGETPVLEDINLHIRPGEMLGILGRTGSGKSSLADLLLRVYDCKKGMLLLDGKPIDEIPLAVLHRDMAYVPQDNFLFSDTLEENIAFGLEERIQEHPEIREGIRRAAKNACIHDNIMDFPEEYLTLVGERGVTLSGGQKQRSSIARALLKDSAVLILDDSLSAVDTDTEEQILENLMQLRRGKTTIVIAHRISTLEKADHIAVLTEGRLTEYGTHEDLVKLGGFYAHISEKQQLEQQLADL
ncbi:MAG: ABC transporter ATP-binding protein/permease [Roseburia sp.]|nr:ABC transporter ATP-binding protein/permease [Roseburia sp.]MCM1098607.1 ABC transporter ATP-binding protein/permease [Ruminococcus flavefaciens]